MSSLREAAVTFFESGLKIDLFVASRRPLGSDQLAHRQLEATALFGGEPIEVSVISAEDILLVKLLWYQEGGNVSERQWNDLLNLVLVQGDRLDRLVSRRASQASRCEPSACSSFILNWQRDLPKKSGATSKYRTSRPRPGKIPLPRLSRFTAKCNLQYAS